MDEPRLELLFTFTATTERRGLIPNGPAGTRVIVEASTGTFDGPAMRGTASAPGGDWVTVRPNGTLLLDVRVLLHTDDGADILMQYQGIAIDGAKHITTAPLFQTGDERYAWLNDVQAIARGSSGGGQVTYDVYAVR
jgi:hypothetical protein